MLGGEDHEHAAVDLTGGLGAVDELLQPPQRRDGIAVGDLRLARLAALERRCRRRAVLVEHQAQPVGGGRAGDVVAGLEVARCRRAEQAVGELCRPRSYADMVIRRSYEIPARAGV